MNQNKSNYSPLIELEQLRQQYAELKAAFEKNIAGQKQVENELNKSGEAQISKTDPDAKSVVLHRNVVNVGYNIQAGCDGKHKLFINNDTGTVNDTHALADMALDAKQLLGVEEMNCLTDKAIPQEYIFKLAQKTALYNLSSAADEKPTKFLNQTAHQSPSNWAPPVRFIGTWQSRYWRGAKRHNKKRKIITHSIVEVTKW
ncbi:MAG: hypothetical protein H8E34_00875 [Bacteroidetes bacterium]|nr:hypothetical protein [Bacteroidota bacterium]